MSKHASRGRDTARGPSQRQLRVGELIRHAIADLLSRGEIMDEAVTALMITVPEVRISPDLKNATVFVTPLAGGDPAAAVKALERNKRWIRGQVATRINLKYAPDLVFRFDDRFEESARIDALLRSPEVRQDLGPDDETAED
ncbi:30S ribosome-binding factor RbfA [Chthonobacter rhizosphaerae]|uniref:30S ribosome-binding factor RbfA n=1 Tax=Chthonobacter rhizosphaerae TaxID=2735553 RepID=UPI0015EF01B7|nr:30S ribosome-binding factor RbfA [Chthonobacter rhizosphaerae]